VGITTLKSLRDGRVMMEASIKKETKNLGEKFGKSVENWRLIYRN